ncbi:MAG TPA: biotin--[acetyl-CoA-carboxylase] ligase [bacterium]|nr:biotin--[acetyl-CoA-carboxylase] ligase [bacterium]
MKEYIIPKNRFSGFYHFGEVSSTMDKALEFIEKGVRKGLVVADLQSGGYGRNGKSWFSPNNGNLYLSFFEKINKTDPLNLIPQRTALAAQMAVKKFVDTGNVSIKWPNDILVDMKKCAGIIAKTVQRGFDRFFVCGIGINVFMPETTLFEHNWKVGAINEYVPDITTEAVLAELIRTLDTFFEMNEEEIKEKYVSEISWMTDRSITYTINGTDIETGAVTGFSNNGSAIKIINNSEVLEISAASIIRII